MNGREEEGRIPDPTPLGDPLKKGGPKDGGDE